MSLEALAASSEPVALTTPSTPATPPPAAAPETDWVSRLDSTFADLEQKDREPKKEEPVVVEKKEEPKVEETKTEEPKDDVDPKSMTPSAGAKFKELKSEVKESKAKIAALEAKLAEAAKPADIATAPEVLAMKAQIAEYEKELSVSRVEATAEYKTSVTAPLNNVLGLVDGLAKKYKVNEQSLSDALGNRDVDKQSELLSELASGFTERDRISLYRLADDVAVLLKRRDEIRSNAKTAQESLTAKEKTKAAELELATKTQREGALSDVWKLIAEKIPLVADQAKADEIRAQVAKTDIFNAKPDVQAYAVYAGAILPHMLRETRAQATKIAELEKTITSIRNASPRGGKPDTAPTMSPDLGFLEAMEASLG